MFVCAVTILQRAVLVSEELCHVCISAPYFYIYKASRLTTNSAAIHSYRWTILLISSCIRDSISCRMSEQPATNQSDVGGETKPAVQFTCRSLARRRTSSPFSTAPFINCLSNPSSDVSFFLSNAANNARGTRTSPAEPISFFRFAIVSRFAFNLHLQIYQR